MKIIKKLVKLIKIKLLIVACLMLIFLPINLSANAIKKTNFDLAIDFIKSQTLTSKDSEIIIAPISRQYNLDSCNDIAFRTIIKSHKSRGFRFSAICKHPQRWTIFLNALVKQKQCYFIIKRPIKRGEIITPQDLELTCGDNASIVTNFVKKFDETKGLVAAHDMKIGTMLRRNDLIEPILVTRSEQVKIINKNYGFLVSTFGKSLNNASKDRDVRVQLPNKQVVTGRVVGESTVEIIN